MVQQLVAWTGTFAIPRRPLRLVAANHLPECSEMRQLHVAILSPTPALDEKQHTAVVALQQTKALAWRISPVRLFNVCLALPEQACPFLGGPIAFMIRAAVLCGDAVLEA
jgi:hypothetical protein